MGWNTTVVVMNDALHSIESDTEFSVRLARAVRQAAIERPIVVHAGGACRAAVVISSHQSSSMLPVLVGGNTGVPLPFTFPWEAGDRMEKELLLRLAHKHGYSLRRRPT